MKHDNYYIGHLSIKNDQFIIIFGLSLVLFCPLGFVAMYAANNIVGFFVAVSGPVLAVTGNYKVEIDLENKKYRTGFNLWGKSFFKMEIVTSAGLHISCSSSCAYSKKEPNG